MAEDFVERKEFNDLKNEVNKIREDMVESSKTLHSIETKIDVISERLVNSDKIDELKINPIEKRVSKLEENQGWIWKLCASAIITGVISAIISFK